MTVTPVGDGWIVHDKRGSALGRVEWFGGPHRYLFVPGGVPNHDADRLRAIADFLDRVTAARKAGGGS